MIWTDEFLFLHYPKTAGKTLTHAFLQVWEGPRRIRMPKGLLKEVFDVVREGDTIDVASAHPDLERAARLLARNEKDVTDLRAVFLCVRNPYTLSASTYYHQRRGFERNAEKRAHYAVASKNDYKSFVKEFQASSFERWMEISGAKLPNLRIIRFEQLQEDLETCSREFSFKMPKLHHLNSGTASNYDDIFDAEVELAVYERYKYLFDQGIYQRQVSA